MKNIMTRREIETVAEVGLLEISVPFPYQIEGSPKEVSAWAAKWLAGNYNLNWQDNALVIGVRIADNKIYIRLMNPEVLQLIIIDSGIGDEIFNHCMMLSDVDNNYTGRATDVFDDIP